MLLFLNFLSAFNSDNTVFLLKGMVVTVVVSSISIVLSMFFGSIFGIIIYEKIPYFSKYISFMVNLMRNLPLLLIIFFTYFALPRIGINLSVFWSTIVSMVLFESAMLSEIIRTGLNSVSKGQTEGALATGLNEIQTLKLVVLPQAFKKVIPPVISQMISLVKDTSLASAIILMELTYRGQIVYSQNSSYVLPVMIVSAFMYFVVNYSLSKLSIYIDKKLVN